MPYPKLDPNAATEVLSVRVSRPVYEKLRDRAREGYRPITTEARKIITEALHLSSTRAQADPDKP